LQPATTTNFTLTLAVPPRAATAPADSIASIDRGDPYIEPLTYVWYQFRFTMMAKSLIDAAGPDVLRRLWDAFALSDEQLAGMLGSRVHPEAGQWLASWNELPR
jgi:hypothetical protein